MNQKSKCPPCNQTCKQGKTCPARQRRADFAGKAIEVVCVLSIVAAILFVYLNGG